MPAPTEEIKSRIDIVELVGSYVRLQKAGANFRAPCPFHNEKTPSFIVSPARQIWHCFGCGKGGDIFRFIMEIEGQDFSEALRVLADRAGVELKREDPAKRSERSRMLSLLEDATSLFQSQLLNNRPALHYLKKRGLSSDTIKEFRIGYASEEWRVATQFLQTKGYQVEEIEKAGLALRHQTSGNSFVPKDATHYDRFRGRIMFPIFDYQGRAVAFGGRIFEGVSSLSNSLEGVAKYINTPETLLYQKSRILYGMHKAKTGVIKSGACVVVEGYMDFLMAYQAGTKHVVASSGTALTREQLKIIRRLCEKLVLAFDMDVAGADAAKRAIDIALEENFDVRVLRLEGEKDPADAIAKNSALWEKALKNTKHIVQFYIDSVVARCSPSTPEAKREFQKIVLPVIAALPSDLERAHWVKETSSLLGIKEEIVWGALSLSARGGAKSIDEKSILSSHPRSRRDLLEERVLGMMAKSPYLFKHHEETIDEDFFSPDKKEAFLWLREVSQKEEEVSFGTARIEDQVKSFVARLLLETDLFLEGISDLEGEFEKCRHELEKEYLRARMDKLALEIRSSEASHGEDLQKLLAEFQSTSQRLSQLR